MQLQDLPSETIVEILLFNTNSLLCFGLVNKSMNQLIKSDGCIQLWKSMLEKLKINKKLKFKEGTFNFLNSDCKVEGKSEKLIQILKNQNKFIFAKKIDTETRQLIGLGKVDFLKERANDPAIARLTKHTYNYALNYTPEHLIEKIYFNSGSSFLAQLYTNEHKLTIPQAIDCLYKKTNAHLTMEHPSWFYTHWKENTSSNLHNAFVAYAYRLFYNSKSVEEVIMWLIFVFFEMPVLSDIYYSYLSPN